MNKFFGAASSCAGGGCSSIATFRSASNWQRAASTPDATFIWRHTARPPRHRRADRHRAFANQTSIEFDFSATSPLSHIVPPPRTAAICSMPITAICGISKTGTASRRAARQQGFAAAGGPPQIPIGAIHRVAPPPRLPAAVSAMLRESARFPTEAPYS